MSRICPDNATMESRGPNNTLIARDKIVYGLPGRGYKNVYFGIQFLLGQ